MINLLPPDIKENRLYGRRNTKLLKWLTSSAIALAGVGLIVIGGSVYLQQSTRSYSKNVEKSNQELQALNVEKTQKDLEDISANTKLSIQVLSREILFSKLLRQLGASLPENTVLKQFQIDKIQGGLTLQAIATDINAATQLQLNLEDPKNKIFQKADIESINCVPPRADNPYPCAVQLKALFTKNNPYLYISPSSPTNAEKKP